MSNQELRKKLELARNAIEEVAKALDEKTVLSKQPRQRQNLKQHRKAAMRERYKQHFQ